MQILLEGLRPAVNSHHCQGAGKTRSLLPCRRRALKWLNENGLLGATHWRRSKPNLQLGCGERDELNMLDLIALAITKRDNYQLLILCDLAYLCSAVTELAKSLTQKHRCSR